MYWNERKKMFFINTTEKSIANKLAESIFTNNSRIKGEEIFKCLHGINRLMLGTVGLNSAIDGPIRYKMFAGIDISQGITEALSAEELPAFLASRKRGPFLDLWEKMRLGWDAISTKWDMLFTGYSYMEQKAILSHLGVMIRNKAKWIISFIGIGLVVLLIVILSLKHMDKRAVKQDIVHAIYIEFCAKLAKSGLNRKPSQGPSDYAQSVGISNQNLKARVFEIIDLYILLRYDRGGDANTLKRFKVLVKHLTI